MIKIGSFDLRGRALGDSQKFLYGGLASLALQAVVAFPESFRDGAGHRLAGSLGDGLSEAVSFWVFDIESHGLSAFL